MHASIALSLLLSTLALGAPKPQVSWTPDPNANKWEEVIQEANGVSCSVRDQSVIPAPNTQASMQACLATYGDADNLNTWNRLDCAVNGTAVDRPALRHFFKGGTAYQSAQSCYDVCYACVQGAIASNAAAMQCDHVPSDTIAHCWMGYGGDS